MEQVDGHFLHFSFSSQGTLLIRLWKWLARHCHPILRLASYPYSGVTRFRRTCYERKWLSSHQLPKPVISVGNMTLGGTGKTPFVIWLAGELHAQGKTVAILSRGYGRRNSSKPMLVSDGRSRKSNWRMAGDEPILLSQHCPWAIVAVGSDRYQLGRWVLDQVDCDCFILDDGYQHLALYRNVDFLLIDVTDIRGIQAVFPAGRLREPLESAKNADGFVFTRSSTKTSVRALQDHIQGSVGREIQPILVEFVPKQLTHIVSGDKQELSCLKNNALLLVSGIGNPCSFQESVRVSGGEVLGELCFPDHCTYGLKEVEDIQSQMRRHGANMVITTEKDAIKLQEYFKETDPIWALEIQANVTGGAPYVRTLLQKLPLANSH